MNDRNYEDTLSRHLSEVQHRADDLQQSIRTGFWSQSQLLLTHIEELRVALEELHVAEEELQQQNMQLLEANQAVEAEQQRYRELFEFAPDGYLVTDIYGTVREANRAATKLLHLEAKYLVGKPLVNFVVPEQSSVFRALLMQLSGVNRVQEKELRLANRQQQVLDVAITVETVRDRSGTPTALRWLIRDISARKQAEAQLRQVQLQNLHLVEANRLKSQFLATISHELRTPMNAILGFSNLLLRQARHGLEPQTANMIERIFNNSKHLLILIEELLDFSRLQSDRLELAPEPFDLAELANDTVEELTSLAAHKQLELRAEMPKTGILVCNDQKRVRQILVNLLSNAIKFTETGSVVLAVRESRDRVIITVQDTGIGIAPDDQAEIFQEFWQVNQTSTRHHSGTGLGLAIVKTLVQLMQGKITLESQLGQGTTFEVELPRSVAI
jgi:PAS domain S-box-containing protein